MYMCMSCVSVGVHIYKFTQAIVYPGQRFVCISDFLRVRRDSKGRPGVIKSLNLSILRVIILQFKHCSFTLMDTHSQHLQSLVFVAVSNLNSDLKGSVYFLKDFF